MSLHVWKIREDLFIRGVFAKRPNKLEELDELDVSIVISMLRKHDFDLDNINRLTYYNFPLPDTDKVKEDALWGAATLAAKNILDGKKVLIHCISARDRCPTAAALTLHLLEGISGTEAMYRVKSKKPTTFRNKAFVAYLNDIPAVSFAG